MTYLNLVLSGLFSLSLLTAQTDSSNAKELHRNFAFTFITPLGTNGMDSWRTVNKVSINLFAGAARGVEGIEVGGFANVTLKNMNGAQGAGFANAVLGNVKGSQFAGFANYCGGNTKGAAFAGFANVNLGDLQGGQFAGFCNYNQKNAKGIQGSGFANVNLGDIKGGQVAGFANVAKNVDGLQASGFINCAKKVKGAQIGFLNIADSVDGASIGFLSIVRHGLHQLEVSSDELFYTNLSIRTGGHGFYNVVTAGFSPKDGSTLWHVGYGVGTSIKVNERFRSDITLSAQHISNGLFCYGTSELYKLYIGAEYKLSKKCHIAAGPTFNVYFGDTYLQDFGTKYSNVAPYSLLNETNSSGFNFKAWVGGKIAIRFF